MTKHDVLTEAEFQQHHPNRRIIAALEDFVRSSRANEAQLNILDWGCGRGRDVLWLRQRGYNAYGVDIDPEPIENGLGLFQSKGHSDEPLRLLDPEGRAPFTDGFFHFIVSGNVLEHVRHIRSVASEMARLTVRGGGGYHVLPAHRQPVEEHLYMPFVHWLPRGQMRKLLIRIFVSLGQEPRWEELEGHPYSEKADVYYHYTVDNLFYRSYKDLRNAFAEVGFSVIFTTIEHPALRERRFASWLASRTLFRPFIHHLLLTYKLVEMKLAKA